ncbi:MAG: hypothetical protein AB1414_15555 [bacterium]
MNRCFNIKGCPASFYLICEAYRQSKNCFEVKIQPVVITTPYKNVKNALFI